MELGRAKLGLLDPLRRGVHVDVLDVVYEFNMNASNKMSTTH